MKGASGPTDKFLFEPSCAMARAPGFFEGTEMPTAGWWEALWSDPAKVLAAVGVSSGMNVIDLCCGDGWFMLQIAKLPECVVAIDIDRQLLDVARLRLAENTFTNCEFVEGDAYELASLVSHPVDFVFLADAFHGVPDKPRLARAVSAALAPGGRFAVLNWRRRPREQTMVLGEPRGPKTQLRRSFEDRAVVIGRHFDKMGESQIVHLDGRDRLVRRYHGISPRRTCKGVC